jgi:anti-sigma regulatory factor (Ser/Thr protein kinase)
VTGVGARWQVTGGLAGLAAAADRAVAQATALGVPDVRASGLRLAVHECLVNAREHGHLGADDLPIELEVDRDGQGTVVVRIADAAVTGPWLRSPDTGDGRWRDRGRGRLLVAAGVDEIRCSSMPGRTLVELRLRIS